jgi:hypothetical protein
LPATGTRPFGYLPGIYPVKIVPSCPVMLPEVKIKNRDTGGVPFPGDVRNPHFIILKI